MNVFVEFWLPLIIWIGGFGYISNHYKEIVAAWTTRHSKFPRYINCFFLATPLIIIEELLTCKPVFSSGCLPTTFPAFHIMLAGLYLVWHYTRIDYRTATWFFGIFGAINEMVFVGRHAALVSEGLWHVSLLFWILTVPIYAIIALVPMYYADSARRESER